MVGLGDGRRPCVPGGECTESEIVLTVLPVNDPPRLSLPRQLAAPSNEGFDVLDLAGYALDIDDEPSDLRWTTSGQVALDVVVEGGALITLPPDADWIGAEMIRVEVCDPWGACASGLMQLVVAPEGSLTLTLIECAGFLLAAEGTSILIDAVYAAPAVRFPGLAEAEPPFEADLILATHSHPDHFDPVVVARYLEARPTATFVGPRDAALRVLAEAPGIDLERVTGVVLDRFGSTELLRGGIRLTLFDLPHGGTPNIGYLIDLGGVRVGPLLERGVLCAASIAVRCGLLCPGAREARLVRRVSPVRGGATRCGRPRGPAGEVGPPAGRRRLGKAVSPRTPLRWNPCPSWTRDPNAASRCFSSCSLR